MEFNVWCTTRVGLTLLNNEESIIISTDQHYTKGHAVLANIVS